MKSDPGHRPATYAAIVFKGDALDPDVITGMIGQSPSLQYRKGEKYTVNDIGLTRRFGLWVYSTRHRVVSDSLEKHLDVIEDSLIGAKSAWPESRLKKIRTFVDSEDAQMKIDIFWHGAEGSTVPKISKSFEQVVEMAGGTVETDFHRDGDAIEAA